MPENRLQKLLLTYAICTLVLLVKQKAVVFWGLNAEDHPPEDEGYPFPSVPQDIKRRTRAIVNDLENIPADLAVFWAGFVAVLVGSFANRCHSEELALIVLMATYTGARVLHSVFYLTSMTPFRSISYMTGLFSVLSASGVLVSAARSAFDA